MTLTDPGNQPSTPAAANVPGSGALAGIKVLDFTRILSGPFATMVLADLGADVIKIESTTTGDDTREWAPPYQGDQSAYFLSVNRNKRGLSIDLRKPAGLVIAKRLAADADVLVENFRPGTADRLGLGYAELSELNPRLIYASISGYGQTGPLSGEPGYDAIAQALSGIMSITGQADGPPSRVGFSSADIAAAMWTLVGILAALHSRHVTDHGQRVDVALLDSQLAWLTYVAGGYFATGDTPQRYGSAHPTIVPYQVFGTLDGDIMIAVGNDALWQRFAPAVGEPGLAVDPRFATNPDRLRNREELLAVLSEILATRSTAAWTERMADAGVPAAPINTIEQALHHPQVLARQMVVTMDHPTAGELNMIGNPIKLSADAPTMRTPPPLIGQDTDSILTDLGISDAEIGALRAEGVVR